MSKKASKRSGTQDFLQGEPTRLAKRSLDQRTCEHWKYHTGKDEKGNPVQIANIYEDGRLVAQKIRHKNKDFTWRGDAKAVGLYGKWLWRTGGKMVVVTEGEIDALTVSQLQNLKWPVVSIVNGAQSAVKAFKKELDWLETFERVVIMFDNDEPGREAAEEAAQVLSPGRAFIATLPLKDANDMLKAGKTSELIDAIWSAKPWRPDGVVGVSDIYEASLLPPEMGLSWPWPSITEDTTGIHTSRIYTLGAGTGMGKTEAYKEVAAHLATVHQQNVGIIMLEEPPTHTLKCLAGKVASQRFHIPGVEYSPEDYRKAADQLGERVFFYDHFGHMDYDTIRSRIRYMAVSMGCHYIVLDHVTALVSGDRTNDERKQLDFIMTDLSSLVREVDIALFLISHLNTPEGKPHEEGGRVMLPHFRGSRAIGQWSDMVIGLERNQQADDLKERTRTTWRNLKYRLDGTQVGKTYSLNYDEQTGRLLEMTGDPDVYGFGEGDDDGGPSEF